MFRVLSFFGVTLCLAAMPTPARADWDDHPGFDFQPQSTDTAPCGVGTPPRGHFAAEVAPASRPDGITLLVRQDQNRLCYVSGNLAEAPVIRIRQGQDLIVTLRNEITDPAAISRYVAIGTLDRPNPPIPSDTRFYPVVPGMHHPATGATNLHVHGFAVPPDIPQDEVLHVCVDPAVGPASCGQRSFIYHYKIPADMPAGLYWYHPHVHGEVQAQMLMGLSGAIVVEGPDDDARRAAGIQDRIFVIRQAQDLDVKALAPAKTAASAPETPISTPPIAADTATDIDTDHELQCNPNGGIDEITLNGAKVLDGTVPDADMAQYTMPQGSRQLWRFLNAATDAYLDLALIGEDGKPMPIEIVARDGAPLTDDNGHRLRGHKTTESEFVPPAGRLEFMVMAPPVGKKAYLVTHHVDTGCTGDGVPERRLALLTTTPTAMGAIPPTPLPELGASLPDSFTGLMSRKTDRERVIALAEYPRAGSADQTDFYIVERRPGAVLRPFEMDGPPTITVPANTSEEWEVENWTLELHAFHIHQVHFRVLSVDGRPLASPPLLDVINVPYAKPSGPNGALRPGRVRIKLYFPEKLAGDIPFHCHLVDHEDNGMMGILRVESSDPGKREQKAELSPDFLLRHPQICRAANPDPSQTGLVPAPADPRAPPTNP
jgi:FtsP/CotA-like multicopper oxidase with cupredoxin domain